MTSRPETYPYFYPRSPRGERRYCPASLLVLDNFYPRSPRGERPRVCRSPRSSSLLFLSTLPARGATVFWTPNHMIFADFYPRSPRGERPVSAYIVSKIKLYFYPRSPRGERRAADATSKTTYEQFLSTLPARGATLSHLYYTGGKTISIHAPREGSDPGRRRPWPPAPNFYPRSPRGERHFLLDDNPSLDEFLSTLPARGATSLVKCM